jgi:hypothetical protein
MGDNTKLRSKELTRIARTEFAREQADALAFVDRNREIVELPPGLENGQTRKRMRGARTDCDCIDEICETVAQGIKATASSSFRRDPFARDVALDPDRASAPRITVPHTLSASRCSKSV